MSTTVARAARLGQGICTNLAGMKKQDLMDEFVSGFSFSSFRCIVFSQFLYGKLFMVMGLLWFFDSLHFLLHGDHSQIEDCMTPVELAFRVLGCFNISRGFFIFLIFVCKRSTISKVCN